MPFSLTWLPDVLKDAGLKVAVEKGWENRGLGDVGKILGVMCHHTGGPRKGIMPSLHSLIHGRAAEPGLKALAGPLCQLGLGRDGTYFVIAAGRANHAGTGNWKNLTNGNSNFIGIEAQNTGNSDDQPWPAVQMDAYHRGVAAILTHVKRDPIFCAGHKEYRLPRGKKTDPTFDMNAFRASVAAIMSGTAQPPILIPAVEPGKKGRPTLRRGATGTHVEALQKKLGITGPSIFGPKTEAAVREFQRQNHMVPDGIVGPKTWLEIDKLP